MTSAAIIRPATDGVKALLPGAIELPLSSESGSATGFMTGSVEKTHLSCFMLRFFSSLRITRASGHTEVLEMSAT